MVTGMERSSVTKSPIPSGASWYSLEVNQLVGSIHRLDPSSHRETVGQSEESKGNAGKGHDGRLIGTPTTITLSSNLKFCCGKLHKPSTKFGVGLAFSRET